MYRIIKIGMDVHSKNYTLCAMEPVIGEEDPHFCKYPGNGRLQKRSDVYRGTEIEAGSGQ